MKRSIKSIITEIVVICSIFVVYGITINWYDRKLCEKSIKQNSVLCEEKKDVVVDNKNNLNDFIRFLEPNLDPDISIAISRSVEKWCDEYNLPYSLVIGLIYAETFPKFNILSKSNKGCIGLMQINYKIWKKEIEDLQDMKVSELYHIDNNIKIGCLILRRYLDKSGNLTDALERYVGGSNREYVCDIYEKIAMWELGR